MGKLIRNGIEYGGGNGTDIFEVTQAEYDALVLAGTLVHNALYVITDAPNLNPTASDIEYSGAVTVKQAIDSKADTSTSIKAYITGNYKLNQLTWSTSASGKYYASIDLSNSLPSNSQIVGVTIRNWTAIRANDVFMPAISTTSGVFSIMSNVNSFVSNDSTLGFSILYI